MNVRQIFETRRQSLLKEKRKLEKQIRKAPAGTLISSYNPVKNKPYYKWYVSISSKRTYIPSCQRDLARELARKKLRQKRLNDINAELNALDSYLKKHRDNSDIKVLLQSPAIMTLLSEDALIQNYALSEDLDKWAHEEYEANPSFPEAKIVPTVDGIMVRSKSEAFIVMLLSTYHIPYRYECRLDIGGYTYYPDFTIRHPITGEYFYWEHVGMLDNPDYAANFIKKLRIYMGNGLIPDHNLILTYETKDHPFDISIAKDKIAEFFSFEVDSLY